MSGVSKGNVPGSEGQSHTVGKGKPPKDHQFKPGVSGNYEGRRGKKKNEQVHYLADLPSQRMFLDEATRLVRVRSGEGTEELPTLQVVMRSLAADAMKPGHPYATREYLRLHAEYERGEFEKRKRVFDFWQTYVDRKKAEQKLAREAGKPEPRLIPHPDDVRFDLRDLTVRIIGPADDDEAEHIDKICRLRDLMFEMSVFDGQRIKNPPGQTMGQQLISFWMVQYFIFTITLPPRLRALPPEVLKATEERIYWLRERWREDLEERFNAEGFPFIILGRRGRGFKLDDLTEQAGFGDELAGLLSATLDEL